MDDHALIGFMTTQHRTVTGSLDVRIPATLDYFPGLLGKIKFEIRLEMGQSPFLILIPPNLKIGQSSKHIAGSLDWSTASHWTVSLDFLDFLDF